MGGTIPPSSGALAPHRMRLIGLSPRDVVFALNPTGHPVRGHRLIPPMSAAQ